jgi:hypothetical protein
MPEDLTTADGIMRWWACREEFEAMPGVADSDREHLRVRLRSDVLARLDAARAKSGRTRTAEIEARLIDSLARGN